GAAVIDPPPGAGESGIPPCARAPLHALARHPQSHYRSSARPLLAPPPVQHLSAPAPCARADAAPTPSRLQMPPPLSRQAHKRAPAAASRLAASLLGQTRRHTQPALQPVPPRQVVHRRGTATC